jgi:hypothetical protein
MPLYSSVTSESISSALGETATAGQVFKADGTGSGTMTKNTQTIANSVTVGKSGDVDFNAINQAITYALAQGAAAGNDWQVLIYPGTYIEPPMTLPVGIQIAQVIQTRLNSVFVVASDPDEDLFLCTGGGAVGLWATGVTNASKACFHANNPYAITYLFSCATFGCSTGVLVDSGAAAILSNYGTSITGPSQDTGISAKVSGTGSSLAIVSGLFAVPAAILPYYSSNPLQRALSCEAGAELQLSACSFRIADLDDTTEAIYLDGGGFGSITTSDFSGCGTALHIGAIGSNTNATITASVFKDNNLNVKISSSTGLLYTNISIDELKRSIVSGGKITGLVQVRNNQETLLEGEVKYTFNSEKKTALSKFINAETSTGLVSGGTISAATGLYVDVAAGEGLISCGTPNFDVWDVSWDAVEDLVLTASATNYIFYDSSDDAVEVALTAPGEAGILLATAITDGSGIRYLHQTRNIVAGFKKLFDTYLGATRDKALSSGLITTEGSTIRKLDISSGAYYRNMDLISYAGAADAGFSAFYGTNGATEVSSQTQLNITQYDNAGTLASMTTDYYRSDTLVLTSDGRVNIIFGTAQYDTENGAIAAAEGNIPTFMEATAFPLARLIIKEGDGLVTNGIIDIRPQPGSSSGGGGSAGVSSHSALTDLDKPADHTWAMLVDGTRAMSGSLNMNSNTITNAGTINGISITAHNARHQPGGADAISTGTPTSVLVAATAAEGSATSISRSDHQHGIATGTPASIGASNAQGSSTSVPRLDHVHAHGDQAGGSVHAVATTSVAGFESAADKTKLDGIQAGATATPLSSTAPVNVTKATASAGVATEAARQDHKHDITTAAPGATAVQIGNSATEGSSTSLSRADHQHAVSSGTPVAVGTANATGSATTFSRSDHVHEGLTRGSGDFNVFTTKTTPVSNDLLLIEDSAASNAKKKVTLGSIVSGITPIFGSVAISVFSEAESTTTSSGYQEKLSLSSADFTQGTYRVGWYAEVRCNSGTSDTLFRVQSDNTATLAEQNLEPQETSNYLAVSGFQYINLTAGSHFIDIDYRSETSGVTSYIRRARLEIWKIYSW